MCTKSQVLTSAPNIDVNKADAQWERTPLYWASYYGRTDIVRDLLRLPNIGGLPFWIRYLCDFDGEQRLIYESCIVDP